MLPVEGLLNRNWPKSLPNDGQAETIITGDQDLLALHPFRSIQIITPGEFLDQLRKRSV